MSTADNQPDDPSAASASGDEHILPLADGVAARGFSWWASTNPGAPQTEDELAESLAGHRPQPPSLDSYDVDRASPGLLSAALGGLRRHWLAILNTLLATLVGVALLAPLGYAVGLSGLSDGVFHAYRFICGQTPSHSFYIAGYQACLCTRCMAIYTSMLCAGVYLAFFRQTRLPPLNWKLWALAMVPMALDGGTQLVGWRESNLALRLLTGALFGLATAWFLFPQIDAAARESLAAASRRAPRHAPWDRASTRR